MNHKDKEENTPPSTSSPFKKGARGILPPLRFPEFSGDWEVKEFSNYIKLYRGSSPRPIQDYLTQDKNGINWIKIGDTKNANNSIIYQVEEKITLKGAEKSRKVHKGELILANSMSFGKTYELEIEGCIYDGWFVLREYEKYFDKQFLLHLLNSNYMQKQYQKLSAGGIVQNISSEIVYQTILFHTSKPEQTKIAYCLSSLDELINLQTQKLDSLKKHKKGLMQDLFPVEGETVPKLRFPEFSGDWEEKTLGDVTKINQGLQINISQRFLEEVENSHFYITNEFLKPDAKIKYFIKNPPLAVLCDVDDILMTRTGNTGKVVTNIKGAFHNNFFKIKYDENLIYKDFLVYFLNLDKTQRIILSFAGSSTIPDLNHSDFYKINIKFPSLQEQKKIADCLSSLDEQITLQTKKLESLKEHKKGLMQQLFPSADEVTNE